MMTEPDPDFVPSNKGSTGASAHAETPCAAPNDGAPDGGGQPENAAGTPEPVRDEPSHGSAEAAAGDAASPTSADAEPADAEAAAAATTAVLLDQITQLQQELEGARDTQMRPLADMENQRKRLAREREDIRKTAASALIEDLLPALDNLRLGLASAGGSEEAASVARGFEFVALQFEQILGSHGLEKLTPEAGVAFDPNAHEAVEHQAHETVPDHCVIDVRRPGYRLNGRLLRPASVVVSSGPPADG